MTAAPRVFSFTPARLPWRSGAERAQGGGRWESLTARYLGIKDVTVSASLPSTSHTCEIPQLSGKDINHLQ